LLLARTRDGRLILKVADFGLGRVLKPNELAETMGVGSPLYTVFSFFSFLNTLFVMMVIYFSLFSFSVC
jgi:hypothetical protein